MNAQNYQNYTFDNPFLFDFNKLACLEPTLLPFVKILNGRTVCNFKEQTSLITIARSIMKHCFGLQWRCPQGNLCPRVPARLNYLLWVYIQLKGVNIEKVLDVGTGATLIYPLLGCSVFGWNFIATEVDLQSYEHSKQLIRMNNLESKINLRLIKESQSGQNEDSQYQNKNVLKEAIQTTQQIDVVVCNPPFFSQQLDTLTTMTSNEHHIDGGEYTFIFNIYRESFSFSNIQYFTCLVGLQSNFRDIKNFLIEEHKEGYLQMLRFGQIKQGNNLRYIVMWKINAPK